MPTYGTKTLSDLCMKYLPDSVEGLKGSGLKLGCLRDLQDSSDHNSPLRRGGRRSLTGWSKSYISGIAIVVAQ